MTDYMLKCRPFLCRPGRFFVLSKSRVFSLQPLLRRAGTVFLPVSALAVAAVLSACGESAGDAAVAAQPAPVEAVVMTVRPVELTLTTELPGRLEAFRQAEVRARVAGIVVERVYKEGEEVKAGTPLFRIDPAPLAAALRRAGGDLGRAEAIHQSALDKRQRYDELVLKHSVSERDHREVQAQERQAQAELVSARAAQEQARLQLDYATVTAPIAGRVRRALVTEGALVGQDTATQLTTVEQIDPIYVNFAQPAADVLALQHAIRAGELQDIAARDIKVKLLLPDGREYTQAGTLSFADLAVDPGTDTVAMRALFPNPQRELLPGAYVQVRFDRAVNRAAVLVPRDALARGASGATVMVVDKQGKVEARAVQASGLQGRDWIVSAGLADGERVIVKNAATFAAGQIVSAVAAPQQTATEQPADRRQQ